MNLDTLYSLFLNSTGVSTDTRKIDSGNLFFALKGPNFDANAFAPTALEMGASAVVVDDSTVVPAGDARYFLCEDVLTALQQLATYHRRKFDIPVIGLTGSNGKTTSKELLHSVLKQKFNTLATQGNLNNHIGVPLTLLRLSPAHQIAIIERLKRDGITNVGIVFNFHHWRGSLAEFPALFKRMQPYLIAVNFNGMSADTTKYPHVRYIGSDESELPMIRIVEASGWRGPIGVIHERPTVDAAEGIKGNLQGLEWVQKELQQPGSGGPKPQEPTTPQAHTKNTK
jgi:hypothetical protein